MSSITLWGAVYDTDYVDLPKTGGGTVRFSEGGGSVTWETVYSGTVDVVNAESGHYYGWINPWSEPIELNSVWRITWNGIPYECTATWVGSPDGNPYAIGNYTFDGGQGGNNEPFMLQPYYGTQLIVLAETSGSYAITIQKQTSGGGSSATLITKTITENGTYSASDDDADGYSSVTVNVPSSAASSWTKVAETSYQVSTTSTSASTVDTWATGHSEIWTSDKIVYVRVRDTAGKREGHFYGTDQFLINATSANGDTDASSASTQWLRFLIRYSKQFATILQTSTTGYGVYADMLYPDGRVRIRSRYNSSNSLTIDGTYKVEVYLLDPAGGVPIFE